MPDWKLKAIRKALLAKGFRSDRNTSHEFYRYYHNGQKTTITTHVSKGNGTVSEGSKPFIGMKDQMHLSNQDLKRFIGCELTGEDYAGLLESLGEL